jgi:hypothetical protein
MFLDQQRLEGGRDFRRDFSRALASATVAVPVVSWHALERMLRLREDSDVDNVLLEWTLILELVAAGRVRRCFPVVLGRVGPENLQSDAHLSDLFKEGVLAALPEVVVLSITDATAEALREAGVAASNRLRSRTVRGTVQEVLRNLGEVVPAAGALDAHAAEALQQALFRRVRSQVLACIDSEAHAQAAPATPPHAAAARADVGGDVRAAAAAAAESEPVGAAATEALLAAERGRAEAEIERAKMEAQLEVQQARAAMEAERAKEAMDVERVRAALDLERMQAALERERAKSACCGIS